MKARISRVWRRVRCRWFKRHDWINPGDNEICSVCRIPAYGWPKPPPAGVDGTAMSRAERDVRFHTATRPDKPPVVEIQS